MIEMLTPRGRKAVEDVMRDGTEGDRAYMAHALSRAALRARELLVDGRFSDMPIGVADGMRLETDEEIEAEAVRMCRTE